MTNPNNSGGFTDDGNGIWLNPANLPAGTTDFDGWTWKQIEAAVLGGGSMAPGADSAARAKGNVDPQTLQDAANIFQTVQLTLSAISQSIKDQTAALAGENGPWKGPSADQFVALMAKMSAKVDGQVDQITGGGDSSRNVPNQLANSANYLLWAQNTLRYIDSYYAQQVIDRGKVLNDGRAFISQFPDAVKMMTDDMTKVAKQLAAKYNTFAVKSLSVPTTATPPPPPPGGNIPPPNNIPPPANVPPPTDVPPPAVPPPAGNIPPPANVPPPANIPPPPGGTPPPGGGDAPPLTHANIKAPDLGGGNGPGGDGSGGDGSGGGGAVPPPVSFSRLSSTPPPPPDGSNANPSNIKSLNNSGDPNNLGGLPGLTPASIPPPPSSLGGTNGTGGTNGLGNIKSPNIGGAPNDTGLGGSGNTKGGGGGSLANIKSPNIGGAPGDIKAGGGGAGGLGNTGAPNSLTNDPIKPVNLPQSLQNPPGDTNNTQAGGGMPPGGMGQGGAGAGSGSNAERPDSAGLLTGIQKPWIGDMPPGLGDPTSLAETPPMKSASWAPPPGEAGGGSGGTGGAPGGANLAGFNSPGADSLHAPTDVPNIKAPQVPPPGSAVPPAGQSMMPPGGMGQGGGGAGAGAGSNAERPDSAGLLSGVDKPWTGDMPDGIGDPTSLAETPPMKSASWAPPPGEGGGAGGAADLAAAHGLGGPTGADLPKDLANIEEPPLQVPLPGSGTPPPGTPGSPMMPPGGGMGQGAGAGAGGGAAERPDSAGLLSGVDQPWTGTTPDGVGDPTSLGETPPLQSASWAPPAAGVHEASVVTPPQADASQQSGPPSTQPAGFPGGMPPVTPGDPGGAAGADHPDSASLLSGVSAPWSSGPVPVTAGEPDSGTSTPPVKSASWAAPAETAPKAETVSETESAAPEPAPEPAVEPAQPRWGLSDPVVSAPVVVPVPSSFPAQTPVAQAPASQHPKEAAEAAEADEVAGGEGAEPSPFPHNDHEPVLRIPVVRPVDVVEDTAAWDVGTAEFLPGLLPASTFAPREMPEEEFVLDIVEHSNEPWSRGDDAELEPNAAEFATYKRVKHGVGDLVSDGEWPTCSGEDAPPEDEAVDEEDEDEDSEDGDEEDERSMADLLSQDNSAWGRAASKPSGVLE